MTQPSIDSSHLESSKADVGYVSLFRNRQFMCLWIAQIFSQLADRAVFVLFVAVLTIHSHTKLAGHSLGAAQMTSLLYIAFTIPAVVLSPVAGVYVDRWSNRTILVLSNIARALFVALVSLSWLKNSVMAMFTLAFLISIGSQFFGPAETASIPRLVKKKDLFSANSLFFTTMMIALGFGFAIGEPIISQTGIGGAPWAISGCFFIAATLLTLLPDNPKSDSIREAWWEELRFGIAYIVDNPSVFRAILRITLLFSTIITLNILAVGLAEQVMNIQPFQFGYIVAAAGLGMIIGNYWLAHHCHNVAARKLVYIGFTGLGCFMTLLGCLGYLQLLVFPCLGLQDVYFRGWLMSIPLLLATLLGSSCALVAVPTQAALQAIVPEELRGKVFGAQNTAMSAASTIPVLLAGVLTDNLPGGVSTTLFMIGLPTFLVGAYQLSRKRTGIIG